MYFDNLLIAIYQACHIYWFQIFKYENEPILTLFTVNMSYSGFGMLVGQNYMLRCHLVFFRLHSNCR